MIKELDTENHPIRGPSRWVLGPRFGLGKGRGKRRRRPYHDFWLNFRNRRYVGFLWAVSLIINHWDLKDEEKRKCTEIDYGILKLNQRIIEKCMFWRTENVLSLLFPMRVEVCVQRKYLKTHILFSFKLEMVRLLSFVCINTGSITTLLTNLSI